MRSAVRRAVSTTVVVALAVLVLPLGVTSTALLRSQSREALDGSALAAALQVGAGYRGDPAELPVDASAEVGLYDVVGRRVQGVGPERLEPGLRGASAGRITRLEQLTSQAVAVPVLSDERTIAIVRAGRGAGATIGAAVLAWTVLIGLAALIAAGSTIAAARAARRLSLPLEELTVRAGTIGRRSAGVARGSGVDEIDAVGSALTDADARVRTAIAREQELTATISHQLRTPLAGLRARLEVAALTEPTAVLTGALADVDRMEATISGLLTLARESPPLLPNGSVEQVLQEAVHRWHEAAGSSTRRLVLEPDPDVAPDLIAVLPTATVLDVLLENALRHGLGAVRIGARHVGAFIAITVADEGRFEADIEHTPHRGIGLALAHRTAHDAGGQLVNPIRGTGTRFTLLMPSARR